MVFTKAKNVNEEEQVVHIRLDRPINLRKEVLRTAIDVTKIMQECGEIMILRNSELVLLEDLNGLSKEIEMLSKKLDNNLPELPREKVEREKYVEKEEVEVEEISDIAKLKAELAAIESKLKEL